MTPERLAELRALAEAATPGPWRAVEGDLEGKPASEYLRTLLANREADGTTTGRLFLTLAPNNVDPDRGAEVVPATTGDGPSSEANAAFIAAARQAVPELRAEVERLTAERDAADERTRLAMTSRDAWKASKDRAEATHRDLVSRLGFGNNITEPMADNDTIVAWYEEESRDASEWQESQLWRSDCFDAGHPDDEDCYEHDPSLRLHAAEAALGRCRVLAEEWTSASCQTDGSPCSWHRVAAECADELLVAIDGEA